jgi:hypothetical protein
LGLSQAPKITTNLTSGINISDLDYLIMPQNALGSTPVFESIKRQIPIYAIKENTTEIDVTKEKLNLTDVIEIETYEKALEIILKS